MVLMLTMLALAAGDVPTRMTLEDVSGPALAEAPASPEVPAALAQDDDKEPRFAIGVTVAYVELQGADEGTMFYGLHARLYLGLLAFEGLVGTAESEFEDGDGEATLVPIQLSVMLMPFQGIPVRPYGLAGVGWYFHDVDYSGGLESLEDEDDSTLGFHLGLGLELKVGFLMLHADFRYVFMDDPDLDTDLEDFDYVSANFGAGIAF